LIIPAQLSALVVDDNDYARALTSQNLEQLGIGTIYQAQDGATGLEICKANKVDFVLLDWYMPEINGAGFTRLLRSEFDDNRPSSSSPLMQRVKTSPG